MNKRVLTMLVLMALAATPAFAYVQTGTFVGGDKSIGLLPPSPISFDTNDPHGSTGLITPAEAPATEGPSQPVPEPGTMAMASMGLMALGATLRRRRGQ
jgi:uncharacterized protein (TIGR03382 family)